MRFILNFIFFGLLFYLIYLFFPDAFNTLVSWANNTYDFLRDIVLKISEKFKGESPSDIHKALFGMIFWNRFN